MIRRPPRSPLFPYPTLFRSSRRMDGPEVWAPITFSSAATFCRPTTGRQKVRSEEHTSELQSHLNLVCRLLLEKKKSAALNKTHRSAQLTYTTETMFSSSVQT